MWRRRTPFDDAGFAKAGESIHLPLDQRARSPTARMGRSHIVANELTNSYLDVGAKLSLWVGPVFFTNYIYGVGLEDGRVVKMGLGMLIGSLAVKLLILLLLSPMLAGDAPLPILWLAIAGALGYRTFRAISGYLSIA